MKYLLTFILSLFACTLYSQEYYHTLVTIKNGVTKVENNKDFYISVKEQYSKTFNLIIKDITGDFDYWKQINYLIKLDRYTPENMYFDAYLTNHTFRNNESKFRRTFSINRVTENLYLTVYLKNKKIVQYIFKK